MSTFAKLTNGALEYILSIGTLTYSGGYEFVGSESRAADGTLDVVERANKRLFTFMWEYLKWEDDAIEGIGFSKLEDLYEAGIAYTLIMDRQLNSAPQTFTVMLRELTHESAELFYMYWGVSLTVKEV